MAARLDHANLTVRDLGEAVRFLRAAFPDFRVRGGGPDWTGSRWVHVGNDVDSTVPNAHPHRKRVYFHDAEGNDWEFVEYLSRDPAERNDYALEDAT